MHNVGVAPFMIGVTAETGAFAGSTGAAMKAGAGVNVGGNLFVTIKTQFALLTALELRMARFAIFLVPGMTLNDGTRHDQRLDLGGRQPGNDN